jgi:hypothetical protein
MAKISMCGKGGAFFEKYLKIIIMASKPAENGEPEDPFSWQGAESSHAASGCALAISKRKLFAPALFQPPKFHGAA